MKPVYVYRKHRESDCRPKQPNVADTNGVFCTFRLEMRGLFLTYVCMSACICPCACLCLCVCACVCVCVCVRCVIWCLQFLIVLAYYTCACDRRSFASSTTSLARCFVWMYPFFTYCRATLTYTHTQSHTDINHTHGLTRAVWYCVWTDWPPAKTYGRRANAMLCIEAQYGVEWRAKTRSAGTTWTVMRHRTSPYIIVSRYWRRAVSRLVSTEDGVCEWFRRPYTTAHQRRSWIGAIDAYFRPKRCICLIAYCLFSLKRATTFWKYNIAIQT